MNKLLIIDGNNVMFRAYYATASTGNLMRNRDGFPTNMVYGFINIYTKVINDDYTHIAVAFDKGSNTRRHKLYKDYKAGRAKTPDELFLQIPYIHKFLDNMNVHYFFSDDYEADDIISSIYKKYKNEFDEIDILSNDNDLFQLISDNSFQIYSKQKETIKYTKEVLFKEKGITSTQVPDYKALIGDKSDNLIGVEGIGPITASKLLSDFNNLDGIYENIDKINGKNKERLINSKEIAYFTKDMATLDPTFKFDETLDDLKIKEPNYEELKKMYTELDFNSFLKKLPKEKLSYEFNYEIVQDEDRLNEIIKNDEINFLILDLLHENYHTSPKIGFGLSNSLGNFYIPYEDAISSFSFLLFLQDDSIKKAVYDYKKMYVSLLSDSIILGGVVFDSILATYLINPDLTKEDLSIIATHFGFQDLLTDIDVYGKKDREQLPFIDIYSSHIAKKAFAINMIYEKMIADIKDNDQEYLLYEVELPFSKVLGDMEYIGLKVDTNYLDEYEKEISNEIKELEKEIYSLVGHEFNILSPKQLGVVLFEELGLKSDKKTKTGYSTDQSVLEAIRFYHPVVDLILRYRMLSKLMGTYVHGVKEALKEKNDNHIHTIYRQTLTDTGRLSSTEPNLQNLPIRNKESSEFRKVFIPEDNSYLLSCDYSQIELRVLAHMSNDENLIKAFKNGEDIHEATAKKVFRKDTVTKEERTRAKAINFGIIYGISAWGLSNDIGISPSQAQRFMDLYHESFKEIVPFTNSLIDYAISNGYVKTIFNRRRYIRDINSANYYQREFAKRTAMNAPIQGSAADILKVAMVKLDKEIQSNKLHAKMILTIHDEIVLNVRKEEIDKTIKVVEDVMTKAVSLNLPLEVESNYGINLYEAK